MIKLWEENVPGYDPTISDFVPYITPFALDNGKKNSAVIVFPGGGYAGRARHEADPIALWLNSIGVSAFVLEYRVAPYRYPNPVLDAQRAIRLVRLNADKYNIDPNKIGILGFSAGGHLAATVGTHYDKGNINAADPVERVGCRPDAMILCYPVITFGEFGHKGSMRNLLGDCVTEEEIAPFANDKQVNSETPPTFLWHTAEDAGVPVENSILFAQALSKNKVPFALHIFPKGRHGIGLAADVPEAYKWPELCCDWLKGIEFI